MSRLLALSTSAELKKWCLYVLVLLAPGSFVILPVVWCVRHFREPTKGVWSYEGCVENGGGRRGGADALRREC